MGQHTVLVVDDDPVVRDLVAEVLNEAGYAVVEANEGWPVLDLVRAHAPSLVLVDQRLPDMSGLDLLERLRTCRAARYIPVMLVSGLAHQLVNRDHGADDVLPKPFDIDDLVDRVDCLVNLVRDGAA